MNEGLCSVSQPQKETQGCEEGEHKDEWLKSHCVWIVGRRLALIFHKIAPQYLCRTFAALNFHVAAASLRKLTYAFHLKVQTRPCSTTIDELKTSATSGHPDQIQPSHAACAADQQVIINHPFIYIYSGLRVSRSL